MFNLGSIISAVLHPVVEWHEKRYPTVLVVLQQQDRTAVARIATFGQPVFLRSVRFELLLRDVTENVVLNRMIPPHSEYDCPLPRKISRELILTKDIAVSASYKTASGREATSEAHVFNMVGGDGSIVEVTDSGSYLSIAKCPKCGEQTLFSNSGARTKRELQAREKAFAKDLRKTCPNHESSRVKFWF